MPRSYPTQPRLCRPFLITPYTPDAEGRLIAEMPSRCPRSEIAPELACRVSVHHHRQRKTGPRHGLTVAVCQPHGGAFTLYPPGYAPYLRQPVLHVSPVGSPVPADEYVDDLAGTVFEAAADAKVGRAWARITEDDPPERWWGTQGRHLELAARLTGIAHDLADTARETIAAVLSVSTSLLRGHSRTQGYRAVGEAVCDVLGRLRGGSPRRAWLIAVCGHVVGRWGPPWRWSVSRQDVERSPFLDGGTACGSSP